MALQLRLDLKKKTIPEDNLAVKRYREIYDDQIFGSKNHKIDKIDKISFHLCAWCFTLPTFTLHPIDDDDNSQKEVSIQSDNYNIT